MLLSHFTVRCALFALSVLGFECYFSSNPDRCSQLSRQQFPAFQFSAMVGRTVYSSKDLIPDLSLRQLFARHKLPAELCLQLAEAGVLSIDYVATLGDAHASVRDNFTALRGGDFCASGSQGAGPSSHASGGSLGVLHCSQFLHGSASSQNGGGSSQDPYHPAR